MTYYVGLDVGLESTSISVLDKSGRLIREGQVETTAKTIRAFLSGLRMSQGRVGIEACSFADWLCPALAKLRLPIVCIEARHAHSILKTTTNKTDRNDARGIATLMRLGAYRPVHMKAPDSRMLRALITARRTLQIKAIGLENAILGLVRGFGLKAPLVNKDAFEAQIHSLLKADQAFAALIEPLLIVRASVRAQFNRLDAQLIATARADPICRRLMTAPGVGEVVAVTYRATIDDPSRFKRSRSVGPYLGLTSRTSQSGAKDHRGRISRWGDRVLRAALFNAGRTVLNPRTRTSPLKEWGLRVLERQGHMKANVAVARKLAVILHRMWSDGVDYRTGAAIA
jgi:transposase